MLKFPNYVIHNIISTADLRQKVDVTQFNSYTWGSYDNELYGGRCGYVKNEEISGRVTVFPSGKLISTGGKSIEQSKKQLEITKKLLISSGLINIKETVIDPIIRNIVATIDINKKINIVSLQKRLTSSTLEPDQFPGLIFRIPNSGTFLIFYTGKMVITGTKSEEELNTCVRNIFPIIKEFSSD